jgi:hypothetical protein
MKLFIGRIQDLGYGVAVSEGEIRWDVLGWGAVVLGYGLERESGGSLRCRRGMGNIVMVVKGERRGYSKW